MKRFEYSTGSSLDDIDPLTDVTVLAQQEASSEISEATDLGVVIWKSFDGPAFQELNSS